jgi:hypothetical protein
LRPIYEVKNLPGKARVNWRIGREGVEQNLETKVLASLKPLTADYPEFIPGHLKLAEYHANIAKAADDKDKQKKAYGEAIQVLESAFAQYSTETSLLDPLLQSYGDLAKVDTLQREAELYLLASIAARQFGIFNPKHKDVDKYNKIADVYLERFRKATREQLAGNLIAGLGSKGAIYAKLLEGENKLGADFADNEKKKLTLIENEKLNKYVAKVGSKIGNLFGRKDMEYEFNVYNNSNDLNAFAFPGGKVFLASGLLKSLHSEAELAGLLAHEMAHAVLSHGTLKITSRFAASTWADLIPLGDVLFPILQQESEKAQEKQADILGTRVLAGAKYPADGLFNVMQVLANAEGDQPRYSNSHPATRDRLGYLRSVISVNNYDIYRPEGITDYSKNVLEPLGGSSLLPPSERKSSATPSPTISGKPPTSEPTETAQGRQQTKDNITVILDEPKPVAGDVIALRFTIDNTAERPEKDRKRFLLHTRSVRVMDDTGKEFPITWGQTSTIAREVPYGKKWSANLRVSGRSWNRDNPANQGLIFELNEASVGSRLFRLAF